MSGAAWAQLGILMGALAMSTPLLGSYIAKVFGGGSAPGDRIFAPVERTVLRICRVDPDAEQRWGVYALSLLAFSAVSVLGLYLLQRVQGGLPVNPTGAGGVAPLLSFNTAASFVTNTNWQNYAGETTMAHLTQMAGLAVANFTSAAMGLGVAIALVRGLTRRESRTIGNFWVDILKGCLRVLLPVAFAGALVLVASGAVQNLSAGTPVTTLEGAEQVIPGGPVASQESIKVLGTNGGGFFNANSAHPFENPTPVTNVVQMFLILCLPFALAWAFGLMAGSRRQGAAVLAAMVLLWAGSSLIAPAMESRAPLLAASATVDVARGPDSAGGNMEGKELRFGPEASGLFVATTTGTSTGAVDASHDSLTPLGGMVPLVNMMLGEVSPGGVGSGLYGMLVFAILAVFIAGLMVGRTPEYLGKKIETAEMKLVVVYILIVPVVVLGFAAVAVLWGPARDSISNPGPHGLSQVVYAYTSAANNNGSAFAGLSGNTDWYNITLGLAMLAGRFLLMVPVLAIAGSLARKPVVPPTAGTFPTGTATFALLLVAVVLVVVGLTYFPVLSLGPVVEHLMS
ncbi:MAG: potassium-transporting ATPase subunit KdpA [Acidimicrobiia bacterium]|nr:potassium-transporting ATPase subunit KdpA [Acidimicrobiia bacterium]